MTEKANYNKPLRSTILICSIRTEEAASDIVRNMLRIIKGDSKTLGNKSSSLSFKNKIDLLYDLGDLEKDEYAQCVKFMELRNQFMHNPNCNKFTDLELEAPDIAKFLKSKLPNDEQVPESNYTESFRQLWVHVMAKLLTLKIEYRKGRSDEFMRFVRAKTFDNFDSIFKSANEAWKEEKAKHRTQNKIVNPFFQIGYDNSEQEIANFEHHLIKAFYDEQIRIVDLVGTKQFTAKDIYQRRIDLGAQMKKELEKENNEKSTPKKKSDK